MASLIGPLLHAGSTAANMADQGNSKETWFDYLVKQAGRNEDADKALAREKDMFQDRLKGTKSVQNRDAEIREALARLGFRHSYDLNQQNYENTSKLQGEDYAGRGQLLDKEIMGQQDIQKNTLADRAGYFEKVGLPGYMAQMYGGSPGGAGGGGLTSFMSRQSQHLGGSNYVTAKVPGQFMNHPMTSGSQPLGVGNASAVAPLS